MNRPSKMTAAVLRISLLFLAISMVACASEPDDPREPGTVSAFALSGVSVIDGRGGEAMHDYTIVVRNGRIDAVVPTGSVNLDGIDEIEAQGKYVIPGLWDLHAHTFADDAVFDLYLLAGVTGIRDMGCPAECTRTLSARRKAREQKPESGPRMLIAGPMLDGDSPYDDYPAHVQVTLDSIPEAISLLEDLNVDFVKVRDFLSSEEFHVIADAAGKAGLSIAGHIPASIPAGKAVEAGLHTVEHEGSLFGGLLLACSSDEEQLRVELLQMMQAATKSGNVQVLYAQALGAHFMERLVGSFDSAKADRLAQSLLESGAAIVPTLIVQDPRLRSPDPVFNGRRIASDPAMRFVPDRILDSWRESAETQILGQAFTAADRAAMSRHYRLLVELVGRFHKAGVPILAGTDAAYPDGTPWIWPGLSLHDELELLVEAGLAPSQAIAAATGNAAGHMGVEDVGTIEPGKVADLILLSADPLADIGNTRQISDVIVSGVFVDREVLTERLANTRID